MNAKQQAIVAMVEFWAEKKESNAMHAFIGNEMEI